jgi:hypothetical protein
MWIAVRDAEEDGALWGVYYEVSDCNGIKGYVALLAEGLKEEEARTVAHRLNN